MDIFNHHGKDMFHSYCRLLKYIYNDTTSDPDKIDTFILRGLREASALQWLDTTNGYFDFTTFVSDNANKFVMANVEFFVDANNDQDDGSNILVIDDLYKAKIVMVQKICTLSELCAQIMNVLHSCNNEDMRFNVHGWICSPNWQNYFAGSLVQGINYWGIGTDWIVE